MLQHGQVQGAALSEKSPYPRSSRRILSRNGPSGSVVQAASSSARASLFARYWTPARAPAYPAPRSLLVLRKNPPRSPSAFRPTESLAESLSESPGCQPGSPQVAMTSTSMGSAIPWLKLVQFTFRSSSRRRPKGSPIGDNASVQAFSWRTPSGIRDQTSQTSR